MDMKRFIYIILATAFLAACASNKTLDINKLTVGMTRSEVEKKFGKPDKVLHAKIEGRQLFETLLYTDKQAGAYRLIFENHKLVEYGLQNNVNRPPQTHHSIPNQ